MSTPNDHYAEELNIIDENNLLETKKSNHKKLTFIGISVFIILAVIITFYISYYNQQKKIEIYKTDGKDFCTLLDNASHDFNIIGQMFKSSTKLKVNEFYNQQYFTDAVAGMCGPEMNNSKQAKEKIDTLYKKMSGESVDKNLSEIKASLDKAYDSYLDLYDLLVSQGFHYASFELDYEKINKEFNDNLSSLKALLYDE